MVVDKDSFKVVVGTSSGHRALFSKGHVYLESELLIPMVLAYQDSLVILQYRSVSVYIK